MFRSFLPCPRRWLIGLVLASANVLASEHGAPAHAAPVHEPAASATATTPATAPAHVEAHGAASAEAHGAAPAAALAHPEALEDPMDRLRERLARRLGATKPPGAENPNLLRIVSKPGVGSHSDADLVTTASAAHAAIVRRNPRSAVARPGLAAMIDRPALSSGIDPGQAHWDYAGTGGPESWGQLKPEFNACASGKRQSPIDIQGGIHVDLDPVIFDYRASAFRVIDNGHTVQVNVGPGNSIEVMGRRYDLVQFHFHRPSEERINGKQFDMVVHLVHRDLEGHTAIIAVLLDRGSALPAIQTVWNNLPLEKGDEVVGPTLLDANELLPVDRSYYTYMGSMTTPPCSEGVLWMVMKAPMPISAKQVGIFARLYPMNARPIQASSGRLIKESN